MTFLLEVFTQNTAACAIGGYCHFFVANIVDHFYELVYSNVALDEIFVKNWTVERCSQHQLKKAIESARVR